MSHSFVSMFRLFIIQCLLTMILALPFKDAAAGEIVSTKVNSYLYEGEEIDLKTELAIDDHQSVTELKVRAQGIEPEASLEVLVNEKTRYQVALTDDMTTLKLNVDQKITSLAIKSQAAFIRSAKAQISFGANRSMASAE